MAQAAAQLSARNYRDLCCGNIANSKFSWSGITHYYQGEDGESLSEIIPFDTLVEDVSEWFGLTPRQRDELVDLGLINFIPGTSGDCFGFAINGEDLKAIKPEIHPQVEHILQGNKDTYLYSVSHLIDYSCLWEMFNWDPVKNEECSGEDIPWRKDVEAEFEVATILWCFNDLNKNQTDLDIEDVISYKEIFRGAYSAPEFTFEIPRSKYNLINNKNHISHIN